MKQFSLLFTLLLLLSFGCGGDDDVAPVTLIGRPDGWAIASIDSDFSSQANAAINALTEEDIASDTRTREQIQQNYNLMVERQTNVEACDQDDALFFLDNGQVSLLKLGEDCSGFNFSVLDDFDDRFYSADFDATRMRIRSSDNVELGVYDILEITGEAFRFKNNRVVEDSTVGPVLYEITYNMVAR